jgi:hypothetical protein
MRGDEVLARKRGAPLALAAREYDLALFVGQPIDSHGRDRNPFCGTFSLLPLRSLAGLRRRIPAARD